MRNRRAFDYARGLTAAYYAHRRYEATRSRWWLKRFLAINKMLDMYLAA